MEEMDELLSRFNVSIEENTIHQPHPRFSQYKAKGKCEDSQEKRREEFLKNIKSKRSEQYMGFRDLIEDEELTKEENKSATGSYPKKGSSKDYRNKIMMSEWLIDVPSNFAQDWVMTFCPIGTRCLIIATKGVTYAYNRRGCLLKSFSSHFPGGSRGDVKGTTLLDGFFCLEEKTIYLLDVMCWNSLPMYDSETDFRIYWLKSKFEEKPSYGTFVKGNTLKLVLLPFHECEPEIIGKALWGPLLFPIQKLDGLLFCHKRNHYTAGVTPLTCWLKGFMVPEILGIPIPSYMSEQIPLGYSNMASFVTKDKTRDKKQKVTAMQVV